MGLHHFTVCYNLRLFPVKKSMLHYRQHPSIHKEMCFYIANSNTVHLQ